MKQKLLITAAIILALTLGACTEPVGDVTEAPPDAVEVPDEVETHDEVELPDEIEPPAQPEPEPEEYPNLKPLELLGYYIDENGNVWADISDWEICEPDVFREYMFGTWEGTIWFNRDERGELKDYITIDDSEISQPFSLRYADKYYRYGDVIIFTCSDYQAATWIFYVDINQPDIMYEEGVYGDQTRFMFYGLSQSSNGDVNFNPNRQINFLTKTDMPINEPENGFMSRLRLHEIMRDYNINFDMIFDIRHTEIIGGQYIDFIIDGYYNTLPIYLISEEPDKLVFKTSITWIWETFADVIYTIEKINDEWIRTVEIDDEQLEAAIGGVADWAEKYNPAWFKNIGVQE